MSIHVQKTKENNPKTFQTRIDERPEEHKYSTFVYIYICILMSFQFGKHFVFIIIMVYKWVGYSQSATRSDDAASEFLLWETSPLLSVQKVTSYFLVTVSFPKR